jgi:hypothetical protein
MRREREAPIGERTEEEVRSWLRARDAGPAPDRLRMRVAHAADGPQPRRISALLRAASAVAGTAAVAVLVLFAVTLRGPAGPLASGPAPTTGPTPTASENMLPLMPVGPWPRTGAVLALPLDGPLLAALVAVPFVAALLLMAYLARRSFADARRSAAQKGSGGGLWAIRSPRAWILRLAGAMLAATLIVVGCDLLQFSQSSPLQYGSFESGDPTFGLGWRSSAGGSDEMYMAFIPGGQLRATLDLSNQGELPLTVTSFDMQRFRVEQPAAAFISSVELRLPPGATMGGSYDVGYYSEAFHPFELPPHGYTSLVVILHLKECSSVAPGPTPDPDAGSNWNYLPTTGYVTIGELPLRYSMLGIERETEVRLNAAISLVFGSNAVTC